MKKILSTLLLYSPLYIYSQICPVTTITTHTSINECTSALGFDFERFGNKNQYDPNYFYNCMFYQNGSLNVNEQNRFISPWETNNNWNVEEFYKKYNFQTVLPDNLHAEGWELIKKWFGGLEPSGNIRYIKEAYPYFILYNKNSGILRLFILLPKEKVLSDGSVPTGTQTFMIKLSFEKPL